ncbi:GlcG/HbpS family heme-binding protein [Leptospira interrogans]
MTDCVSAADLQPETIWAILKAGAAVALRRNVAVSLSIVDSGGHLVGFVRMPGVHTATTEVAQAKARSAAAFNRSTRGFAQQLTQGNLSMLAVPGCVPLPGGIPLKHKDRLIGAVGVSGASPDIDEEIAEEMSEHLRNSLGPGN